MSDECILVTGGTGFIGSHLIEALVAKGYSVINADLKPPQPKCRARWWELDVTDAETLRKCIEATEPSIIYNLAAHASLVGGRAAMEVNIEGVRNLIEIVRSRSSRPLIVQASTQLVTGVVSEGFDPLDFRPYGLYGESKVEAEMLFRAVGEEVSWTIVRPTNIWGPRHPTFASSIWRYIGLGLYIHPEGRPIIRSYGYVSNVVQQLVAVAEVNRREVLQKTFYLGDKPIDSARWLDGFSIALRGKRVRRAPISVLRVLARSGDVLAQLGAPSPINSNRLSRMTSDFPVPMEQTFAVLGHGSTSLDDGIQKTVGWLKSQ